MEKVIIDRKNRSVTVHFNTKFYPADKIMIAAQAFMESCWAQVDGDKNDVIQVNLTPKSDDIDLATLGYEFYNYVLGVIKNQ
jgi:hypothetical protein